MNENDFPLQILSSMEVRANLSTIKFYAGNYKYYMMEYVVDGAGFVEYKGKRYHCKKDSIYMLQPDGDYLYYHDPECPWRKIFAVFTGKLAAELAEAYNLKGKVYFPGQTKCLPYFKELLHLKYNANEAGALIIHHIFNLLQSRDQSNENIPPAIHTLKEYLESSLDRKFLLNDFAAEKNVSSAYLISKFKEYYNCTPYEYLIQCRLNSAVNMLKYTHLSIKEISTMLNFNDQYYFSNIFKQRCGMSPVKFRKLNQDSPSPENTD